MGDVSICIFLHVHVQALGRVTIQCVNTQPHMAAGERNVYALIGKAAEPVAEAHVVVEAQARGKPVTRSIAVSAGA